MNKSYLPTSDKKRIEAELLAAASTLLTYGLIDPTLPQDDLWMEDLITLLDQYYDLVIPS